MFNLQKCLTSDRYLYATCYNWKYKCWFTTYRLIMIHSTAHRGAYWKSVKHISVLSAIFFRGTNYLMSCRDSYMPSFCGSFWLVWLIMDICPICNDTVLADDDFQVIKSKGCSALQTRGIQCVINQKVHAQCRRDFSKKKIEITTTSTPAIERAPVVTRGRPPPMKNKHFV